MNTIKKIYKKAIYTGILATMLGFSGCVDDNIPYSSNNYDPAEDPDMVCLPFNVAFDIAVNTKADNDSERATAPTGPESSDGSEKEHKIDFDTDKECFAIFFDKDNHVRYMKRLYLSEQLGSGGKVEDTYPEFTVPVVCYIPKSDCIEIEENGKTYYKPDLLNVLVVLNGGKIYDHIRGEIYQTNADGTESVKPGKELKDVLKLKWSNPAEYMFPPYTQDAHYGLGEIGKNANGNLTMTSSAYWEKKSGETNYKLMTAAPITGKAYSSVKAYVESGDDPTATVSVERMVAKFSAPSFQTAVIGANRVFRPDQNAMALVIYEWDKDNNPVSAPRNWRIHLLGWTINGNESESYIFKNIGNIIQNQEQNTNLTELSPDKIENDNWPNWNEPGKHRSYWAIDPHYMANPGEFYPWQFRRASDRMDIISVQAGLNKGSQTGEGKVPVLRYKTFKDIIEKDTWQPTLYFQENTFNPDDNWYDRDAETYLDGRASLLAGPHLLLAGELYLEGEGYDYSSSGVNFGTVDDLYGDRLSRFYKTEKDWFMMFFREFNKTTKAQEAMSFPVYDWDENAEGKSGKSYQAFTDGEPRLFFGEEELTYDMIKDLAERAKTDPHIHFSTKANVRNGDGRLIPWLTETDAQGKEIRKLTIRLTQDGRITEVPGTNGKKTVQRKEGQAPFFLPSEGITGNNDTETENNFMAYWEGKIGEWNDDMYKSIIYEWFGPIDHYVNGYMYYAGAIRQNAIKTLHNNEFFGTVRNHWYKFHVVQINSLGTPVDDLEQLIIPENYNYKDQLIVYLDVLRWHSKEVIVNIP